MQSQSLNFALQSYNIFLNYANLFGGKVESFLNLMTDLGKNAGASHYSDAPAWRS